MVAILGFCLPQRDPWMYPNKQRRNLLGSLCIIFMRTNITDNTKPAILHGLAVVKLLNREKRGQGEPEDMQQACNGSDTVSL